MPGWSAPHIASWDYDENHGLILLKLPEQIKVHSIIEKLRPPPVLSTLDKPSQPPRTAPTLSSLPTEIHFSILHHLAPVDRVCVALTCRRLCASVLSSPRLTPKTWLRFTNITELSSLYWNQISPYLYPYPTLDRYNLNQRLAHGWVDKKQWRHCWKCNKILPREEEWWWKTRDHNGRKRIEGRKNPRWNAKTGVSQNEWVNWNKKKKLKWMIAIWCKAGWEDSSVLGCEWCREKMTAEEADRIRFELNESKTPIASRNKEMDVTSFVGTRHPVECPSCLEQELTFTWRRPRWMTVKKVFSTCGLLGDLSIELFWCVGSFIFGLLAAVCDIITAIFDFIAKHIRSVS